MATVTPSVAFTTLGMFIIDEIEQTDHSSPKSLLIGGAGTYAALGARLVAGKDAAHGVGWVVDMGSDFPVAIREVLESWNTSCVFRADRNRLTTRAWNGYDKDEERAFKYLTPKLRLNQTSIPHSHLFASVFHFVCSASRAMDLVRGIIERRQKIDPNSPRPTFVWEPIPDLCVPSEMTLFLEACRLVDIVSPNQRELAGFFEGDMACDQDRMAAKVLESGIGRSDQCEVDGLLVVRAGRNGCYAYQGLKTLHIPAYHLPVNLNGDTSRSVADPTGGGNAFLGALSMALASQKHTCIEQVMFSSESQAWKRTAVQWDRNGRVLNGLILANIAAAFAIEQAGMPTLSTSSSGKETWNDEDVEARVRSYTMREKKYILDQARNWQD